MKQIKSPNFDTRQSPLQYIVLHYTGMQNAAEAVARLCDPAAKVSAHYLIDEAGDVIQLVAEEHRAWHAGKSFWRGMRDLNSASIGIELVNPGHEFGYRPFAQAQIGSLKILLRNIIARQRLDAKSALLAHSDIAPARKEDPGELFPWRELAQENLGVWPLSLTGQTGKDDATEMLAAIGYDVTAPQKAILAFQRRFYPENLTGVADAQTLARIEAVNRLLNC